MTESTQQPEKDEPVREPDKASGQGAEIGMSDEPNTFEPEEDPDATEGPRNPA